MPSPPISLSAEEERRYRQRFLRQDVRSLLLAYGLAVGFNLLFVVQDYLVAGKSETFELLLADRGGMILLTTVAAWIAYQSDDVRRHDVSAITWGLVTALMYIPVISSRPAIFTHNLIAELVVVMLFHLMMPDNPHWRAVPALAFSTVSLGMLLAVKQAQSLPALVSIGTAFVVVNLVCIVVGLNVGRYRRRFWQEENRLEELAQQRLEMLEMRNRLIATLSHEFRTPLNAVASSAALLDGYHERLGATQRADVLARMRLGVTRLTEMLDQALFISRSKTDCLLRRLQRVDIDACLRQIADEMRILYPECTTHVASACTGRECSLDVALVRRIVFNLVSNACKFTAPDGNKTLSLDCDDAGLSIRMRDSGVGIAAEDRNKVFAPFVRGANAGQTAGTGMGLAIVQEAVDQLNGRIELTSAQGKGTTVAVHLPWLEIADE